MIRASRSFKLAGVVGLLAIGLAGCEDGQGAGFSFGKKTERAAEEAQTDTTVTLVERDVEAADVFQVTDQGLWDGRPSLGGVWVAYPGDVEPERVIIRNEENKKFVIGALFKRERDNPGPKFQISSDAAAALGILAGKPAVLNVTALRREQVPEDTGATPPQEKSTDINSIAAAAIDKADGKKTDVKPAETKTIPETTSQKKPSKLAKPYIQIGIFSIESNANNSATSLRTLGVIPIVKKQSSKGKTFWRVLIGPATSSAERSALLKKARSLGFSDAYFVTN